MAESKYFSMGATSITTEVATWDRDGRTPKTYRCTIQHSSHSPSSVIAERDNPIAAEREALERFLVVFQGKRARTHSSVIESRKASPRGAKPARDDFEY